MGRGQAGGQARSRQHRRRLSGAVSLKGPRPSRPSLGCRSVGSCRGTPSSRPRGSLAPGLSSWHSFFPVAVVGSAKECFFCHNYLFRRVLLSGQVDWWTSVRGFAQTVGMEATKIAFVVDRQPFQKVSHLLFPRSLSPSSMLLPPPPQLRS